MPGRSPKIKGNTFEREIVQLALASKVPARRAWGSNGAAAGWHPEVDVMVADCRIQCKRRAGLPAWLTPSEHVDAVATRQDRGEALIVMRLSDWLDWVSRAMEAEAEGGEG
jgi:hypothetical protein